MSPGDFIIWGRLVSDGKRLFIQGGGGSEGGGGGGGGGIGSGGKGGGGT